MFQQKPESSGDALASPYAEIAPIGQRRPKHASRIFPPARVEGCIPPPAAAAATTLPSAQPGPDSQHDASGTSPADGEGWLNSSRGSGKRRVFTAGEKARIVAESYESGQSVCSVARRHRLMASQVFAWRKSARIRREDGLDSGPGPAAFTAEGKGADGTYGSAVPAVQAEEASLIEISAAMAAGRVQQGTDAATLMEVPRALSDNS